MQGQAGCPPLAELLFEDFNGPVCQLNVERCCLEDPWLGSHDAVQALDAHVVLDQR